MYVQQRLVMSCDENKKCFLYCDLEILAIPKRKENGGASSKQFIRIIFVQES
jgi:hypothetical protein